MWMPLCKIEGWSRHTVNIAPRESRSRTAAMRGDFILAIVVEKEKVMLRKEGEGNEYEDIQTNFCPVLSQTPWPLLKRHIGSGLLFMFDGRESR